MKSVDPATFILPEVVRDALIIVELNLEAWLGSVHLIPQHSLAWRRSRWLFLSKIDKYVRYGRDH